MNLIYKSEAQSCTAEDIRIDMKLREKWSIETTFILSSHLPKIQYDLLKSPSPSTFFELQIYHILNFHRVFDSFLNFLCSSTCLIFFSVSVPHCLNYWGFIRYFFNAGILKVSVLISMLLFYTLPWWLKIYSWFQLLLVNW